MENIEDFDNWEDNRKWWALRNADKAKVKEKWKGIGFIEVVDEEYQGDLANTLETLVLFVLSRVQVNQSKMDSLIETLIFPIVIRVFRALPELMCHDYVNIAYNVAVNRIPEVYKEIGEIHGEGIDWEAEICAIVADEIIVMFSKNQTGQN